ncbi:hypothetical protein AB4Z52_26755 [Rhizobium sp. 2YAF20]|uniref:hypothetical protein n=1 Tax=Rhizobium sp. 2YAF20 TaxID=3233027 RepID=UPI003F97FE19
MLARSSVKAVLLCSGAIFLLPNLSTVMTSQAGNMTPFATLQPLVAASSGADAMVVMPQTPVMTVAPSAPATATNVVMPSAAPAARAQPVIANVAPGENPFAPTPAAAPVARTAPAPQPATADSAGGFKGMAPAAALAAAQTAPAPASGSNSFAPAAASAQAASSANAPAAATPAKVDDTALRYYATNRDLKRLGAELRRLKALYPDWEAPENLFDQTASVEEQPLWDMYATGNYTGVRAELARLQSTNPQWKPSTDLISKLSIAESRKLVDRAYGQANWQQVITTAQQQPDLLVCSEMNTMWQVGEALAKTRDFSYSFELYKYILTHCDAAPDRMATIQKASQLLPEAGTTSLLAFGRTMPDGTSEFANLAFDSVRKRMGQIAAGDQLAQKLTDTELQSFASFVVSTQSEADAGLFGWYYYGQKQWQAANAWFSTGTHYGNDPKNLEGVVLTLRNLGKVGDAFQIASQYIDSSEDLRKEYIEIVASALTQKDVDLKLSDKDIETFKTAVYAAKSALGAQALGWKALDEDGVKDAATLFAQSMEWNVTEGGVLGMAVVSARTKDYVKLASLKSEYGKTYGDLDNFKTYSRAKPRMARVVVQKKPERPKSLLAALFD